MLEDEFETFLQNRAAQESQNAEVRHGHEENFGEEPEIDVLNAAGDEMGSKAEDHRQQEIGRDVADEFEGAQSCLPLCQPQPHSRPGNADHDVG